MKHPTMHHRLTGIRRQRGLSVIELMVGLTIGMIMVAGLALMFGNATRSSLELEKTVRHIENGRQAIDVLSEDLALAGFYGTLPTFAYAPLPSATPCSDSATLAGDLASASLAGGALPALPLPVEGVHPGQSLSCLTNRKSGTPALVLRRVDTAVTAVASIGATNQLLYVQDSHHAPDNFYSYKVTAGNPSALDLKAIDGTRNAARRFLSRVYYIATCSNCNNGGDGIPTLVRLDLVGAQTVARPVAEGIDQIAFDYGFDNNGDGAVDIWWGLNGAAGANEAAAAANDADKGWKNLVAVRVALVSRNIERTAGFVDGSAYNLGLAGAAKNSYTPPGDATKRRNYVATIRLATVAGRRESP